MTGASNLKISRINPLMLIVMLFCYSTYGKVIYVDDDAVGANDGSSWTDAYPCLQNALMVAQPGDEIRVAQGIYKPDREVVTGRNIRVVASGDRTASFQLIDGVAIKGGYAGFSGPDPNEREISLYETILSGDLNGDDNNINDLCDLLTEPTRAENSYSVVTGSVVNCLLDGFTISGGNANGPMPTSIEAIADPSEYGWGGGMHLIPSSVTITNCTFRNNAASGGGGGIFSVLGDGPILNNCVFTWNSGGSVVIEDSAHYGFGGGGGMYNEDNNPTITNCTFTENFAPTEGGGMYNGRNNPILTNCTFVENSAYTGGGMYNSRCNATLTNCIFTANSAKERGGGMESTQSNLTLTNCIFSGNSAYNDFFGSWGGGINSLGEDTIILTHCTFAQNYAREGNALCDYNLGPSNIELINCILWDGEGSIWYHSWDPDYDSTITIAYSNIQGGWSGEGGYNIDADPMFAVPGYWTDVNDPNVAVEPNDPNAVWINGDYHLKSQAGRWDPVSQSWVVDDVTSPCIDGGDPNNPIGQEPFPNGGMINMGAYGGTAEASKSPSGLHTKYGIGTGEPNDPYLIYTAELLNNIGLNQEDADKHFKLMADIDLSAYKGDSFNRIGVYEPPELAPDWRPPFTGVFDGNGHTISNFTYVVDVNEPLKEDGHYGEECVGLFGYVDGPAAQVKNLGLIDPNIYPAATCTERVTRVGAIVGRLRRGSIINCYVEGGRISADMNVGGLVGSNIEGTISDCYTTCDVTWAQGRSLRPLSEPFGNTGYSIGGIVGYSRGWIYNCNATGSIQGTLSSGGLVGNNDCDIVHPEWEIGVISNSYATGDVTGDEYVGGLVGDNSGRIHSCHALGNVSGSDKVGGLVGDMIMDEGSISDSYATGDVSGNEQVGGLVGYSNGSIQDSYATGETSGTVYVGGLVGWSGSGTIYRSYASGTISGSENVGALVGRNGAGTIHYSYAIGSVSGDIYVGGLVGTNFNTIQCCYAANAVSGIQKVGGLVGDNWGGGTITTCFWNIETSGLTDMCGIQSSGASGCDNTYGKTTTEMQTANTFLDVGWDFVDETDNGTEDIWWILEGQDYPRLWWELSD